MSQFLHDNNEAKAIAILCFSPKTAEPRPGGCGERVRLMIWWLRRNFFTAYFHLSPLLKHVRKVVSGFGKKFVLVLV